MELFAANLKKRALDLGISNAEVARRAGLSERRYGNYVSGRREPDLATLIRIASVLETTPNDLLQDTMSRKDNIALVRARSALSSLDESDLNRVVLMLEALVGK